MDWERFLLVLWLILDRCHGSGTYRRIVFRLGPPQLAASFSQTRPYNESTTSAPKITENTIDHRANDALNRRAGGLRFRQCAIDTSLCTKGNRCKGCQFRDGSWPNKRPQRGGAEAACVGTPDWRGTGPFVSAFSYPVNMELEPMQRRRFKNVLSFPDRLAYEAGRLREEAEALPPSPERDAPLKKARQADIASHMDEWLSLPGLRPPD